MARAECGPCAAAGVDCRAQQHPVLEKVYLQVIATHSRAIALYTSLGFKEEGRQIRDVKMESGEYVDVLIMARFVKR